MENPKTIQTALKDYSFSLDQLRKISNNDAAFIQEMLLQFISMAKDFSDKLNGALAEDDFSQLGMAAHKVIPAYSILDLIALSAMLKKIEKGAEGAMTESETKDLLRAFESENKKVISEMCEYLKELEQQALHNYNISKN